MSEEYKILYKEYEIAYTTNEGIVSIEVKDNETGKIYHSKFKLFKVIKELQQELTKYKEKCEKVNELKKVLNNEMIDMLPFDISEQVQDLFDEILEDKVNEGDKK